MRKYVNISEIYTDCFGETMKSIETPFVEFAREINNNLEIKDEETKYYAWLKDLLDKHGHIWHKYKTEEDIIKRVNEFRMLIVSLGMWGYDESQSKPLEIYGKQIYGDLMARKWGDGWKLYDGNHRLAILYILGYSTVPLTICK